MHFSPIIAAIAISQLFLCSMGLAQEKSDSSSQNYVVRVPQKVKLALQPAVKAPSNQAKKDVATLVFMAETTSGATIQFETEKKHPLNLTVGGDNWWASSTSNVTGSTGQIKARACSVQASTFHAGSATLRVDVAKPANSLPVDITTIIVTIVPH